MPPRRWTSRGHVGLYGKADLIYQGGLAVRRIDQISPGADKTVEAWADGDQSLQVHSG